LEADRKIGAELHALIRRMSAENPLWGAPRIPDREQPRAVTVPVRTVMPGFVPGDVKVCAVWVLRSGA